MYRSSVSRGSSRGQFRGSLGVHPKNKAHRVTMRGGVRL